VSVWGARTRWCLPFVRPRHPRCNAAGPLVVGRTANVVVEKTEASTSRRGARRRHRLLEDLAPRRRRRRIFRLGPEAQLLGQPPGKPELLHAVLRPSVLPRPGYYFLKKGQEGRGFQDGRVRYKTSAAPASGCEKKKTFVLLLHSAKCREARDRQPAWPWKPQDHGRERGQRGNRRSFANAFRYSGSARGADAGAARSAPAAGEAYVDRPSSNLPGRGRKAPGGMGCGSCVRRGEPDGSFCAPGNIRPTGAKNTRGMRGERAARREDVAPPRGGHARN